MSLSIESSLEDLVENEGARAVMDRLYPVDTKSMNYKMGKKMSLKAMSKFPQSNLSAELLGQIDAELNALS